MTVKNKTFDLYGDHINLVCGMNLFLAFFLLLKLLSSRTPASYSIPIIGAYFCLNMVLITLSTFISATVINMYKREDKRNKVPKWLKKVAIDGLSRILCMEQRKNITQQLRPVLLPAAATTACVACGGCCGHPAATKSGVGSERALQDNNRNSQTLKQTTTMICKVKKVLKNFMGKLQARDAKEKSAMEWRLVALSIDRMFFMLYLITIIVSTVTIYVMCHVYYESDEHGASKCINGTSCVSGGDLEGEGLVGG
ncbi:hypothetical protein HELRODRAFT_184601 [Helobdella robusta]|uniref:Neurotransmitter-gated ion-channel transmembrane domain-containing protein n=1 Tax=Helobdella robusta TaxID=6412 RepID=V3VCI7_HELRO|nr:hypothetical protein HELRODRAFT_184601 [Helobdella robusta]ESO09165.1 hypothetical protein HELRODRAFT_184601 [Helobdella robusta]